MRKNHVGTIGDLDPRNVDAERRQRVELFDERPQIDNGASPDEELHVRMHHSRRDDSQSELAVADDDRMTGIVATAKARDHVVLLRIEIDDPALAFVAPLQPDDDVSF